MIKGIDVVFIHVKNPEKMAKWYKDNLGLDITVTTPDESWQEFHFDATHPTRFALDYTEEQASEVEKQSIVISFRVEDIVTCVKELSECGVTFYGDPVIKEIGQSLVATFRDPGGNWLQLSQRR